jgi:V8-like Glu-specific endopeptidase
LIAEGRYFAVDTPERVRKFLTRRDFSPQEAARLVKDSRAAVIEAGGRETDALERFIGASDLMGVAFLERGVEVARTIGRIWVGMAAGQPKGYATGFLVSPRLLMSNFHILGDPAVARTSRVEFGYELRADGAPHQTSMFAIDPETFHFADRQLDYAVVAVAPTAMDGGHKLADFGFNSMIEDEGKAIAAQWVNIIQHPEGRYKQLALRENRVVDILEQFLHYQTDTAPGASGAPVYNDRWEVVALHHSGVKAANAAGEVLATNGEVWRQEMGDDRIYWVANEGARISRIIANLRGRQMIEDQRRLFDEMMTADANRASGAGMERFTLQQAAIESHGSPAVASDGTVTWTVPITVSIRVGATPTAIIATQAAEPPATNGPGAAPAHVETNQVTKSPEGSQPKE